MKAKNFTRTELENYMIKDNIMFFQYKRLYQLMYSQNAGFYFSEIENQRLYGKVLPYTKAGRFHAVTPKVMHEIINN